MWTAQSGAVEEALATASEEKRVGMMSKSLYVLVRLVVRERGHQAVELANAARDLRRVDVEVRLVPGFLSGRCIRARDGVLNRRRCRLGGACKRGTPSMQHIARR